MQRVYAKPFVEASELIGQLLIATNDPDIRLFHESTRSVIEGKLSKLIEQLEVMNLEMTVLSARRLLKHVLNTDITVNQCKDYLIQTRDRLTDEIGSTYLIVLNREEMFLYEEGSPHFGNIVTTSFPSITYDINESAKCLALARTTASAFHSIRCLEAAIRAISRCLRIPDPTKAADRNWGKMLDLVKQALLRHWPTSSDRLYGDGQIFDELYASLASIQNPWRNATMHLDQKYTGEEAKDIFYTVGGLMKRVASRCDEEGEPKI